MSEHEYVEDCECHDCLRVTVRKMKAELTEVKAQRDDLIAEVAIIRKVISDCSFALGTGEFLTSDASISIMRELPSEIRKTVVMLKAHAFMADEEADALRARLCQATAPKPAAVPDIADICNAYESGVGHNGRPTANVNPYQVGSYEHEAYRLGATGTKHNGPAAVPDEDIEAMAACLEDDASVLRGHEEGWEEIARNMDDAAAALLNLSAAQSQPKPAAVPDGYAGVFVWVGNQRVKQLVTEHEIRFERDKGNAITQAAQKCLDMLAAAQESKP